MGWLRRFQVFIHPKDALKAQEQDVVHFLTYLAEVEELAASGQDQCFNALLFFFRHVLGRSEVNFKGAIQSKRKTCGPGKSCPEKPSILESWG